MSSRGRNTGNTATAARSAPGASRNQPRSQMRGRSARTDHAATEESRRALDEAFARSDAATEAQMRAAAAFSKAREQRFQADTARYSLDGQSKQYQANLQRAIRAGARVAPDELAAYQRARSHSQELSRAYATRYKAITTEYTRLSNITSRTRTPEQRARLKELRGPEGRVLQRLQKENAEAYFAQGKAATALMDAVRAAGGMKKSAFDLATAHEARAQAALDRAESERQARQVDLQNALAALDRARGGSGEVTTDARKLANTADYVFGRPMSRTDLARMAGLSPNAKSTTITAYDPRTIWIRNNASGAPPRGQPRQISIEFKREQGRLNAHVEYVGTRAKTGASGRALVRDMLSMRQMGVQRIYASASGSAGLNGYYSWARLGFTGSLPDGVRQAAQQRFGANVTTVEQVMQQPGGAGWWKHNGGTFHATFDFSNPYSMGVLERFQQALR